MEASALELLPSPEVAYTLRLGKISLQPEVKTNIVVKLEVFCLDRPFAGLVFPNPILPEPSSFTGSNSNTKYRTACLLTLVCQSALKSTWKSRTTLLTVFRVMSGPSSQSETVTFGAIRGRLSAQYTHFFLFANLVIQNGMIQTQFGIKSVRAGQMPSSSGACASLLSSQSACADIGA